MTTCADATLIPAGEPRALDVRGARFQAPAIENAHDRVEIAAGLDAAGEPQWWTRKVEAALQFAATLNRLPEA